MKKFIAVMIAAIMALCVFAACGGNTAEEASTGAEVAASGSDTENIIAKGKLVVGITDYAQDSLGDLVFVNLPEIDADAVKDEAICDVESVKAVSDIFSPVIVLVSAQILSTILRNSVSLIFHMP